MGHNVMPRLLFDFRHSFATSSGRFCARLRRSADHQHRQSSLAQCPNKRYERKREASLTPALTCSPCLHLFVRVCVSLIWSSSRCGDGRKRAPSCLFDSFPHLSPHLIFLLPSSVSSTPSGKQYGVQEERESYVGGAGWAGVGELHSGSGGTVAEEFKRKQQQQQANISETTMLNVRRVLFKQQKHKRGQQ